MEFYGRNAMSCARRAQAAADRWVRGRYHGFLEEVGDADYVAFDEDGCAVAIFVRVLSEPWMEVEAGTWASLIGQAKRSCEAEGIGCNGFRAAVVDMTVDPDSGRAAIAVEAVDEGSLPLKGLRGRKDIAGYAANRRQAEAVADYLRWRGCEIKAIDEVDGVPIVFAEGEDKDGPLVCACFATPKDAFEADHAKPVFDKAVMRLLELDPEVIPASPAATFAFVSASMSHVELVAFSGRRP